MLNLECYREEIRDLYIEQNAKASEVIDALWEKYRIKVTPKQLKTRLDRWGYHKNFRRSEVVKILRQLAVCQTEEERQAVLTSSEHAIDIERVERYRRRTGLPSIEQLQPVETSQALVAITSPRTPSPPLNPLVFRISEKLLYDIDILIRGSFEAGLWTNPDQEQLIDSSPNDIEEKINLQEFLADIDNGCASAAAGESTTSVGHWLVAFSRVDGLVTAKYHDVIPNIVQKINDLNSRGYPEVAQQLKRHVAMRSAAVAMVSEPTGPKFQQHQRRILSELDSLDLSQLAGLEERLMACFDTLVRAYIGALAYNSFAISMHAARRILLRWPWADCVDHLPDLTALEATFGMGNRRVLDLIALELEVLYERGRYAEAESVAYLLIARADTRASDEWQRFYHMTRGYYWLGCAQYHAGNYGAARENLGLALWADRELCAIDDLSIFDAQKVTIKRFLADIDRRDTETTQMLLQGFGSMSVQAEVSVIELE